MRRMILPGLCVLLAASVAVSMARDACAQQRSEAGHGAARGGGFAHGGAAFHGSRGGARGGHAFHQARRDHDGFGRDRDDHHAGEHGRRRYGHNRARVIAPYGYGYGYLPDDMGLLYDTGPAYVNSPSSGMEPTQVVEVEPSPVAEQKPAQAAAAPPQHAVIKEYKWPAKELAPSHSTAQRQVFAIVLKDGATLSAVSVYASNDALHFVDPDSRHMRVAMSEVDRTATLNLNRARNLNLYLPAAE